MLVHPYVSAGTQVVVTAEARGTNAMPVHLRGAVGIVARTPAGTVECCLNELRVGAGADVLWR